MAWDGMDHHRGIQLFGPHPEPAHPADPVAHTVHRHQVFPDTGPAVEADGVVVGQVGPGVALILPDKGEQPRPVALQFEGHQVHFGGADVAGHQEGLAAVRPLKTDQARVNRRPVGLPWAALGVIGIPLAALQLAGEERLGALPFGGMTETRLRGAVPLSQQRAFHHGHQWLQGKITRPARIRDRLRFLCRSAGRQGQTDGGQQEEPGGW